MSLERFLTAQQEWSQATFGTKKVRGPLGPLDHLKKEVEESIQSVKDLNFHFGENSTIANIHKNHVLEEFADCFFLIVDAVWRAGFSQEEFENALWEKLKINQNRKWPLLSEQDPTKATEHDRS